MDPCESGESIEDMDPCESIEDMSIQLAGVDLGSGASAENPSSGSWICAICLEKIKLADTAQIKGCEHAYCANCILTWASYKEKDLPWCPQCKFPFSSLFVCRTLDGRMSDYMVEESLCLLLKCKWFKPVPVPVQHEADELDDYGYQYQDEDELYEQFYTSSVRLGNRRWGDTGYVRGGRQEARPVSVRQVPAGEGSGSGTSKGKEKQVVKENVGRRAKRAQKRVEAELKLKQAAESVNS